MAREAGDGVADGRIEALERREDLVADDVAQPRSVFVGGVVDVGQPELLCRGANRVPIHGVKRPPIPPGTAAQACQSAGAGPANEVDEQRLDDVVAMMAGDDDIGVASRHGKRLPPRPPRRVLPRAGSDLQPPHRQLRAEVGGQLLRGVAEP